MRGLVVTVKGLDLILVIVGLGVDGNFMSFKKINVCVIKRILCGQQVGGKNSSEELLIIIQIRSDGGSNQGTSSRGGEK